jgi:hypothetical protein
MTEGLSWWDCYLADCLHFVGIDPKDYISLIPVPLDADEDCVASHYKTASYLEHDMWGGLTIVRVREGFAFISQDHPALKELS